MDLIFGISVFVLALVCVFYIFFKRIKSGSCCSFSSNCSFCNRGKNEKK